MDKQRNMDQHGTYWRWQITPHPYDHQWDSFVTNSDSEAQDAIEWLGERYLWDGHDGEGPRTVTVNLDVTVPESDE